MVHEQSHGIVPPYTCNNDGYKNERLAGEGEVTTTRLAGHTRPVLCGARGRSQLKRYRMCYSSSVGYIAVSHAYPTGLSQEIKY